MGTQLISGMVMARLRRQKPADDDAGLPFIFVPFIIGFPAGLVLYWITTNIWTIGQQFVIKKIIPLPEAATPEAAAAAVSRQATASAAAKTKKRR